MAQSAPAQATFPTDSPQLFRKGAAARGNGRPKPAVSCDRGLLRSASTGRAAIRGGGDVIELGCGITMYPARSEGGRWRAVWHEDGQRQQCARFRPHGRASRRINFVPDRYGVAPVSVAATTRTLPTPTGTSPLPPGPAFRRSRCCLFYRIGAGGRAAICGDCVLGRMA
jgi:hypothetical protein